MNRQLELFPTINEAQQPACFLGAVSGSEFLSIVEAALQIAYEAGKWEGQVELEEHFDREQYLSSMVEVFHSRKNAMPLKDASTGKTVTVNLRSEKWREGVRKSAKDYVDKAMLLVISHYHWHAYGSVSDRQTYDDACDAITDPEKLKEFKKKREDKNRSSISKWLKAAWEYGEGLSK